MSEREAIVAAARSRLGVRYAPHQRSMEGMDCAGLPIDIGRERGYVSPDFDINGYTLFPDGQLLRHCRAHLVEKPAKVENILPADVIIVSWGQGNAQHFGIAAIHPDPKYGGCLSLIHASNDKRHMAVIEHRLEFSRHMRLVAVFSFPGVA